MGRSHGSVVALLVEAPHVILLRQGSPDFEGLVEVALVAAEASSRATLHNKNIISTAAKYIEPHFEPLFHCSQPIGRKVY
jgi:hypothetical protein